jgi:hypothetical protein
MESRAHPNGTDLAGSASLIAASAPGIGEGDMGGDAEPRTIEGPGRRSPARLLGGNPCGDLFPYSASSDDGTVEVVLELTESGQPLGSRIVDETPRGQGFALAARHCVRRLRFAPALDGSGHAIRSRSVVQLHFARRGESPRAAL